MADIPIERKQNRNIWPIIIGILVLLAIIWFLVARCHDTNGAAVGPADSTTTLAVPAATGAAATNGMVGDSMAMNGAGVNGAAMNGAAAGTAGTTAGNAGMPAAVAEYARFVANADPVSDEAKQHTYAAGGIRRLADALAAAGATGAPIDNMRNQAASLLGSNPASGRHSDMVRSASASAADAFASIKTAGDASRVRAAATAIKPGTLLMNQKNEIQDFFMASKDALQTMNTGR